MRNREISRNTGNGNQFSAFILADNSNTEGLNMKDNLTQDQLKKLLHYDKETGIFTWKVHRLNQINAKTQAGSKAKSGYRSIKINRSSYREHRLAWLYVYGYFPENFLDHINRIRDDNRIVNLREASFQCNARNANVSKRNKTGVTGVHVCGLTGEFVASISVDRRNYGRGSFKTLKEAAKARWDAEVEFNFPNCNTTSSAYLYLKDNNV